jgi:hypothetical protein
MDTVRRTRAYKKQRAEGRVAMPLTHASGGGGGGGGALMSAVKVTLQRTATRSDVPVLREPSAGALCKRVAVAGGVSAAIAVVFFLLLRNVAELQGGAEL